jgi:hypothetical protein
MASGLEGLPDTVRAHAAKMSELVQIIENAPLSHVVQAVVALKVEIAALVTSANRAAIRRV